jgi:hypothetical protein
MNKKIMLIPLVILPFALTSCNKKIGARSYGDFLYKIDSDTNTVYLMGFTKEGEKKDVIVVPTTIENRKVTTIGYEQPRVFGSPLYQGSFYGSYSKLYIHSQVKSIIREYTGHIIYSSKDNYNIYMGGEINTSIKSTMYFPFQTLKNNSLDKDLYNVGFSNLVYYLNDGTDNTLFSDDIDGTKVEVIPPTPYNPGYTFTGWYKEPECINLFDFDNEILPKKLYDSEGFVIRSETKLYAGLTATKSA